MTILSGVYEIRNNINGHRYIGSSVNLAARLRKHKHLLRLQKHCNPHFQNAWNKYGEESFAFTLLLYCDPEMTLIYEQTCLDGLRPEYNAGKDATAATRGLKFPHREFSEEHKQKLSEAAKKHSHPTGFHHTEASIQKMRDARTGTLHTEEHKHKISEALKGHATPEETRQKISATEKGRVPSAEQREKARVAMTGYVPTEEARKHMSEAQKKRCARERGEL